MSFSILTKNELARVMGSRQCCKMAELLALIKMDGSLQVSGRQMSLNILNHNAAVARKVFKLVKELFGMQAEVLVKKRSACVRIMFIGYAYRPRRACGICWCGWACKGLMGPCAKIYCRIW